MTIKRSPHAIIAEANDLSRQRPTPATIARRNQLNETLLRDWNMTLGGASPAAVRRTSRSIKSAAVRAGRSTAPRTVYKQVPARSHSQNVLQALRGGALDGEHFLTLDQPARRDIVSAVLDRAGLSPTRRDVYEALQRGQSTTDVNVRDVQAYLFACSRDAYYRAFMKVLSGSTAFSADETEALNFYRQHVANRAALESGTFGLAIPVLIDDTLITAGTLDDASVLSVCKVVLTTTNVYKGVAVTSGGGFQLAGEGGTASDDTPTFSQPVVNIFTLTDFVPFSIEFGMDFPGWLQTEAPRLFAANYADRVALDTSVGGDGVTAPQGIFSGLVGVTTSTVHVGAAGTVTANDVRTAWSRVPERAKNDPSCAWHMSSTVWQQISAQSAPSVSNGLGPNEIQSFADGSQRLMSKKVVISTYDPAFTGSTGGSTAYAVVGAFARYCVAQRVGGVTVELAAHLRDPATGRPTGERGLLAFARHGAAVLDAASFVLLAN
jgi:HK97 family phage major capsid protein